MEYAIIVSTKDIAGMNIKKSFLNYLILKKLAVTKNPDTALKALELSAKALGYGARQQNLNLQQNFVVAMPQKHATPESWAEQHAGLAGRSPALTQMVQEISPR